MPKASYEFHQSWVVYASGVESVCRLRDILETGPVRASGAEDYFNQGVLGWFVDIGRARLVDDKRQPLNGPIGCHAV